MPINSPIAQTYANNVPGQDTADGSAPVKTDPVGSNAGGCTLVTGHTYVFSLGGQNTQLPGMTIIESANFMWDATFVGTLVVEATNFAHWLGGENASGPEDVKDWDTRAGTWVPYNPSGATIPTVGAGVTVTNATVTVAGGAAGGCIFDIGNSGARRLRVKVVATTGGVVRCGINGKMGAG